MKEQVKRLTANLLDVDYIVNIMEEHSIPVEDINYIFQFVETRTGGVYQLNEED